MIKEFNYIRFNNANLTEQEFITCAKQDKDAAFSYLTSTYAQKIYGSCIQLLRNSEDAEDLVQEVFVSIYLSLDSFGGKSKLSTWIYAITHNKAKEFLRNKTRLKRSGTLTILDEHAEGISSHTINFNHPGVQLEDKERAAVLFEAIDSLAENQARAYRLAKIEGYSYAEIGEIMELSVSSIESLLFRANKCLREILADFYQKNKS
ncbi:MAG: sigma-70 family RNA polymerase sigma factor [Crocinitomicaceae bacterium]|nr:sigma-70 family RNA polymerase sigma factor [Crocinitomicaceae bacterium]